MLNAIAGDCEKKWQDIYLSARLALQARLHFLTCLLAKIQKKGVETRLTV